MYTLITKATTKEGNMSIFGQVMFAGEIVKTGERCCEGGRRYWRWFGVEYIENLELEEAINKARELGLEPKVHTVCGEHTDDELLRALGLYKE